MSDRGEEVHGEITSADLTTAAAFTLFDTTGVARTLLASERLVVTDIVLITAAGGAISAFFDTNADGTADAGEIIVAGTLGASGGFSFNFIRTPRYGPINAAPSVVSDTVGQIDAQLTGYILQV